METLIRAAVLYAFLLVLLRLSGRRTLAQMTPFDFVLLLIVSEAAQQALLGEDFSLTNAVLAMTTLIAMDIALSILKRKSSLLDQLIDGRPTILVVNGVPDSVALRQSRVDVEDILTAARIDRGIPTLAGIAYAILETDGRISIIPEHQKSPGAE